jgi:hypothetical protein
VYITALRWTTFGIYVAQAHLKDDHMAEYDDKSQPPYSQKWWIALLDEVEKEMDKRWRTSGDRIVARYLDDRTGSDTGMSVSENAARYNIFWANVQIMKSALYATPPSPGVTRQNGDSKDDVARTAALMLERMLSIDVNKDTSEMHAAFKHGVEDRLIPGMGQVWLRYDVQTAVREVQPATPESLDPMTGAIIPAQPAISKEVITKESAPCDYVHWRDFLWSPARTWEEVWWVARRVWMKKKSFVSRFGQDKYEELRGNYDTDRRKGQGGDLPKGFAKGRVEVFEIWCEDTNKVYFVNRYCDDILEEMDDPLKLDDFFPCPKPLFATHTTSNLYPRADYTMCQDQYAELDILNDRITTLTRALRVVGVYDKAQPELSKLLTGPEFAMVPVDNWSMLAEKGGLRNSVDWFPVEQVAAVLEKLMVQRQGVIGQIYELTSISDIMRGASNARETAKAQTLKAQYSSVRLQLTQQDVARWVMAAMRIKAEIIGRWFQPETIIAQSQIEQTESAKYATAAVELIKNFEASQYRIEVGEETLSIADYTAEREQRTEYLTAVGQFLSQSAQVMQGAPDALPFLLKMVQWVTASFRSSSDIESVLDEAIQLAGAPKPPPQPDPSIAIEQAKGQLTMQIEQGKAQTAQQIAQGKAQADAQTTELVERNKAAIAQMQIESAERIAGMNNETKIAIESLKAELTQTIDSSNTDRETSKQQMQIMLERMAMVNDAILQSNAGQQRKEELQETQAHERAESDKEIEAQEPAEPKEDKLALILEKLTEAITKPKTRRVKSRDAKGNIMEVEEI